MFGELGQVAPQVGKPPRDNIIGGDVVPQLDSFPPEH